MKINLDNKVFGEKGKAFSTEEGAPGSLKKCELGIFSIPYLHVFGLNTEIQSEFCKSVNIRLLSEAY